VPRRATLAVTVLGMVTGLVVPWFPWDRWPRWSLLVFPVSSHLILGLAWLWAPGTEARFLALYVLCYLFGGLTQRQGVSLWLVPLTFGSALLGGGIGELDVVIVTCSVGVMVAEVLALLTSRERTTREHLGALLQVTRQLSSAETVEHAARVIADQARAIARADAVLVYTADQSQPGVYIDRANDPEGRAYAVNIATESSGTGVALRTGEVLMVPDAATSTILSRRVVDALGCASAMFLPIPGDRHPAGVMAMSWRTRHSGVSPTATQLLEVLRVEAGRVLERLAHTERLSSEVVTDPLTSLGNRRRWTRELDSLADGDAVALFDVDRFKQLNDDLGHERGDAVLVSLATCLQTAARAGDTVCRLGGDEFAVILRGAGSGGTVTYLDRLRACWDATIPPTSFSAGWVVAWPGAEPVAVQAEADRALYEAKRTGRDRAVASPGPR
jgi:diguanylate cyclase (GGDEF)-like protein